MAVWQFTVTDRDVSYGARNHRLLTAKGCNELFIHTPEYLLWTSTRRATRSLCEVTTPAMTCEIRW